MKDLTILSTACGAMFMPGFFNCLKENGERNIKIIGVDMEDNPFMDNLLDGYYQVPTYTDDNYVDILLDICKKERIDIFFPQISMELPIILKRINDFRRLGVKVAMSDGQTLNVANNKFKLYEHMKKHGLRTPEYYHINNVDELVEGAKKLGFPEKNVVVKVTESSGSRGVRIIKNNLCRVENFLYKKPSSFDISMEDMCKIIKECKELPDTIVMEYLPGCEYTVDLLADHGKTLYIAGRRNYESSMSIAMASLIEKKDNAYKLCEEIVSTLGLDGNIGFDFMLDENNNPVLTDLNPRITATIIIYKDGGLNLPYLRVKQLMGEKLPKIGIKYGIRMKRRYWDVFE
ncbi:ATP-grasp domain-containing protein [Clostridium sp.]|uniref:ATP-grasp domain-containing protein n=1 Tax=Clostridium sp. TaxID=1506 RepID=UPI001E0B48BE|nr:ATP-grasp domain-containing protein [Clostridium sp.]MBS5986932.1 ATP-grasp domain-containing protein [Clostridium sp.]